jgi:hypothetical protein
MKKNQWPLAAAAYHALNEPESLDCAINLVGAMHEVGLLANSKASVLRAWTHEQEAWAERCFERLLVSNNDADFWALAALLGMNIGQIVPVIKMAKLNLVAMTEADSFKQGQLHHATLVGQISNTGGAHPSWVRVLEIAWAVKGKEVVSASRWRAITLEEGGAAPFGRWGRGHGTHHLTACAPFGCWRTPNDTFDSKNDCFVNPATTALSALPGADKN